MPVGSADASFGDKSGNQAGRGDIKRIISGRAALRGYQNLHVLVFPPSLNISDFIRITHFNGDFLYAVCQRPE